MNVRYSDEEPLKQLENAIFLAGPTPRSSEVHSWRPEALRILRDELQYKGIVCVPERRDWAVKFAYEDQVEWEYASLSHSTAIAIWVPRCMQTMPALTTNVEFGYWLAKSPHRVVYGRPDGAPNTRYLDWLYEKITGRKPVNTLESVLRLASTVHIGLLTL